MPATWPISANTPAPIITPVPIETAPDSVIFESSDCFCSSDFWLTTPAPVHHVACPHSPALKRRRVVEASAVKSRCMLLSGHDRLAGAASGISAPPSLTGIRRR